jgi:hypothetical protein
LLHDNDIFTIRYTDHIYIFYLLSSGSRIKTAHEFGLVTLDIDSVRTSDVGIYTCKAVNLNGEATCTTSIKVQGEYSMLQPSVPQFLFLSTVTSIQSNEYPPPPI